VGAAPLNAVLQGGEVPAESVASVHSRATGEPPPKRMVLAMWEGW
jgi:hypothetical protein